MNTTKSVLKRNEWNAVVVTEHWVGQGQEEQEPKELETEWRKHPWPLLLVKTTHDSVQNDKNIKFPTQKVIIERGRNYYLDLLHIV